MIHENSATDSTPGDIGPAAPELDLTETANEFYLRAALPGLDPTTLLVEATSTRVSISARCSDVYPRESAATHRRTHQRGRYAEVREFACTCNLPEPIDVYGAEAFCCNGMLEIRLPRIVQEAAVRIPVRFSPEEPAPSPGSAIPITHSTTPPQGIEKPREGHPASKIGAAYVQTAAEDHTTRAHQLGIRDTDDQQTPIRPRSDANPTQ